MWTICHRGVYVHGYFDREECRFTIGDNTFHAKSLHAAKCLIARKVKL